MPFGWGGRLSADSVLFAPHFHEFSGLWLSRRHRPLLCQSNVLAIRGFSGLAIPLSRHNPACISAAEQRSLAG
jgi:hypothetical protein